MPILDAIELMRASVYAALAARTARPVRWLQAGETDALPLVIFLSQDAGGNADARIGRVDWQGIITVKAAADTPSGAAALLADVAPGMDALVVPTGYAIRATYLRPIILPPDDGVWQSGHSWRVFLTQE